MKNIYLLITITFITLSSFAQKARVKGVILDEFNTPIENVTVKTNDIGTVTNSNGFYLLDVPANQKIVLILVKLEIMSYTIS